jgi:hypothetical protein
MQQQGARAPLANTQVPGKFISVIGCVAAQSCGISCPNASTTSAPGKPVCTTAKNNHSGTVPWGSKQVFTKTRRRDGKGDAVE